MIASFISKLLYIVMGEKWQVGELYIFMPFHIRMLNFWGFTMHDIIPLLQYISNCQMYYIYSIWTKLYLYFLFYHVTVSTRSCLTRSVRRPTPRSGRTWRGNWTLWWPGWRARVSRSPRSGATKARYVKHKATAQYKLQFLTQRQIYKAEYVTNKAAA